MATYENLPEATHAAWALGILLTAIVVSIMLMGVGRPESAWGVATIGASATSGLLFRLHQRLRSAVIAAE